MVSYRSVPRILNLFHLHAPFAIGWIPHFTSVINWTLQLGLGLLHQVGTIDQPWLAIIDHSIDIGTKKALVVLRVKVDALSERGAAIQLHDCECIGLTIAETVNGETTAQDLEAIFAQSGQPAAIIKDCDATLNKGTRLYSEKQAVAIPVIEDIGHVMASALKSQFEKTLDYKRFTALTSQGAHCLRQTDLAFLVPPKLRSKGRFLSIGKLGQWGEKMSAVMAVSGRAKEGTPLARLRKALPGLTRLKPFIRRFANTTQCVSKAMEILKNNGLNQATYEQCLHVSETLPKRSKVKKRLQLWLKQHIILQKSITPLPLLVSSDIIESLFGNFKHIIERSPQADMNRTVLLIPALCGQLNDRLITQALSLVRHDDLKQWEKDNIPYTMRKKRQAFFNENESQKSVNIKA